MSMYQSASFAIAWVGVILMLAGCDPTPDETQVVARVRSPDRKLEAVYAEDLGGGPATGVYEDVYIVEPGHFPRIVDRVFANECVGEIQLRWVAPRLLLISYGAEPSDQRHYGRDDPSIWWAPWLWASSRSSEVQVRFERHALSAGAGC